jgi:hypothetical protein
LVEEEEGDAVCRILLSLSAIVPLILDQTASPHNGALVGGQSLQEKYYAVPVSSLVSYEKEKDLALVHPLSSEYDEGNDKS